ncbi:hypothetical protein GCM10022234_07550 [Aeromicrobium panaciterrae]|uniref:FtsB family cell division protein n=1 Tax=Aeromicrobium panaciterrae TaxID=363861 RepID=UPI0031E21D4C
MASRSPRGRPGRQRPPGQPRGRTPGRTTQAAAAKKPARTGSGPQLTTRAIVLLSVVLLLVASYTSTLHAWWDQRGDIQSTKAEIVMRKQAIEDLNDEKARWEDPAYVKQQARARFGWVMPGEVGYRVIGADGVVRGDVPTLDEPPAAKTPQWYDKLWGSVKQSGKEPSDKKPEDPDAVIKKQ